MVTNHPNGGPVFSGPQLEPYQCQETALDAQCNEPRDVRLPLQVHATRRSAGLQPYDPDNPPSDVATTTTDEGVEVPFIVRQEQGFQDRDRYTILTLFSPGEHWRAWAPQKQWNHKLLVTHGGGCGASYAPGTPPLDDYSGTIPSGVPGVEPSYVTALGRGFAVLSTALDNTGHNCNLAMQAESLMMAKERLVEQYGDAPLHDRHRLLGRLDRPAHRRQRLPGHLPGPGHHLLLPRHAHRRRAVRRLPPAAALLRGPVALGAGRLWTPTQMAAVEGHPTARQRGRRRRGAVQGGAQPRERLPGHRATRSPATRRTRYDSETNPRRRALLGARLMVNLLGPRPGVGVDRRRRRPPATASPGCRSPTPACSTGSTRCRQGTITAGPVRRPEREGRRPRHRRRARRPSASPGDPASIANAYRTGLINEANHLDEVAIINHGGPDPGAAHDYAHAWWTEERLQADQGHTDNRVMWFGPTPLIGDPRLGQRGAGRDGPLARARSRRTTRPTPAGREDRRRQARRRHRPLRGRAGVDARHAGAEESARPLQTRLSHPAPGGRRPVANDNVACRLQPLDRGRLRRQLDVAVHRRRVGHAQAVFPDGVCDWTRPGRGQGPAETWLRYGTADGGVVYGGRNLPGVPAHSGDGWSSPSFRELLRR